MAFSSNYQNNDRISAGSSSIPIISAGCTGNQRLRKFTLKTLDLGDEETTIKIVESVLDAVKHYPSCYTGHIRQTDGQNNWDRICGSAGLKSAKKCREVFLKVRKLMKYRVERCFKSQYISYDTWRKGGADGKRKCFDVIYKCYPLPFWQKAEYLTESIILELPNFNLGDDVSDVYGYAHIQHSGRRVDEISQEQIERKRLAQMKEQSNMYATTCQLNQFACRALPKIPKKVGLPQVTMTMTKSGIGTTQAAVRGNEEEARGQQDFQGHQPQPPEAGFTENRRRRRSTFDGSLPIVPDIPVIKTEVMDPSHETSGLWQGEFTPRLNKLFYMSQATPQQTNFTRYQIQAQPYQPEYRHGFDNTRRLIEGFIKQEQRSTEPTPAQNKTRVYGRVPDNIFEMDAEDEEVNTDTPHFDHGTESTTQVNSLINLAPPLPFPPGHPLFQPERRDLSSIASLPHDFGVSQQEQNARLVVLNQFQDFLENITKTAPVHVVKDFSIWMQQRSVLYGMAAGIMNSELEQVRRRVENNI